MAEVDIYRLGFTVLASILSAALGIIGYFLKDIRSTIKEKNKEQDLRIDKVEKEISDFKAALPRHYVLRDDFLRSVSNLDNKVDNISKEIGEINKNLNKLIGGDKNARS